MIIIPPDNSIPIVNEKGLMFQRLKLFFNDVAKMGIIIGTGNPEGAIIAQQGQEYMDETGTAGAIKYIKRDADIAGDQSKGWILI